MMHKYTSRQNVATKIPACLYARAAGLSNGAWVSQQVFVSESGFLTRCNPNHRTPKRRRRSTISAFPTSDDCSAELLSHTTQRCRGGGGPNTAGKK